MKKLLTFLAIAVLTACLFPSCKSNGSGTSSNGGDSTAAVMKKNMQTAIAADSTLMKHDVDGYFKLCAKDYTEYGSSGDKPEKNIDSIKAEMKTFFGAYPDFKGDDIKAYAGDNGVAVTGTYSGTFKNPYMTMKPTGKAFKVFDADIFTFDKDGKITSHKSIVPGSVYMSQAGVVLPDKK